MADKRHMRLLRLIILYSFITGKEYVFLYNTCYYAAFYIVISELRIVLLALHTVLFLNARVGLLGIVSHAEI